MLLDQSIEFIAEDELIKATPRVNVCARWSWTRAKGTPSYGLTPLRINCPGTMGSIKHARIRPNS
jgi:hypothetical protein